MDEEVLPRSAVSLVRELFEEVLAQYEETAMAAAARWPGFHNASEALAAELTEYRRRFKEIEGNLYSGPNSGH